MISSRIRLARNLKDYSFPGWAGEEERLATWKQLGAIFSALSQDFICWEMGETSPLDKEILFDLLPSVIKNRMNKILKI